MFFKKRRILKRLQISPERAKLLSVKLVRIKGVTFLIRKVAPVDFIGYGTHPFAPVREAQDHGADITAQKNLDTILKSGDPKQIEQYLNRIKEPMKNLLMKGVLWPELSEKEEPNKVWVDDILSDMTVANGLVEAIGSLSLLQKKTLFGTLCGRKPSNLTQSRPVTEGSPTK